MNGHIIPASGGNRLISSIMRGILRGLFLIMERLHFCQASKRFIPCPDKNFIVHCSLFKKNYGIQQNHISNRAFGSV